MAGIYLHIPFCKQACHYCDFHFSTNQSSKDAMIEAMIAEIGLQKEYLQEPIETIYFGGGTPSLLDVQELNLLIDKVHNTFDCVDNPEITIEANPDDLTSSKIVALEKSPINRLSIGIQTFDESRLAYINRAHTKQEALSSVKLAQDVGFNNLSIDLIYAIPPGDMNYWVEDLSQAVALNVPHISLYGLTIEPQTVFGKWMQKGAFKETVEDIAVEQYKYAVEFLTSSGYEHYEVANFSKLGCRSKHNAAYWQQKHYLGIGPGAHSFNGHSRQSNVRNNQTYIKKILNELTIPFDRESLSKNQKINEYLLTRLRAKEGVDSIALNNKYSYDLLREKEKEINQLIQQGLIEKKGSSIILSIDGFMVADEIALILFLED